jgi:hypothetical protein
MSDSQNQPANPAAASREKPEPDELAKVWKKRIEHARKHWEKFHKRVQHNRGTVAGFDWTKDPKERDFYKLRANLIHGTITSILPSIYSRNPEISAVPTNKKKSLKLFCKTIETITNRHLESANLKARAKATVRSALTSSFGIVKVMYQRDITEDPIIKGRIQDTQDNIKDIEGLMADMEDADQRGMLEAKKAELHELMAALNEKVEVTAAEGLVIDRVLTDHLLIDPSVAEFDDYRDGDWLAQIVPMKKAQAESLYEMKFTGATGYDAGAGQMRKTDGRMASGASSTDEDQMIVILEIWDKRANRVYTMAEGCDYWARAPYSPPKAGERWYPFFLLPFNVVDGQFVAPSIVDLTEQLQGEHNDARDSFNAHRKLIKPGWIAGADISEKTIKRYSDSYIGEITIIDTEGKPLSQVIVPKQHPPIDPAVYDTSAVRYDWEQVTGLQDAARGSVVKAKTATEADIMQQNLSGRVSEFRDQVEDWLQEIASYSAQILLMELTVQMVERIMGEPEMKVVDTPMGPMEMPDKHYDWPEMSREEVFDMIDMKIRAGTTGAPDKVEQQESWGKLLPVIEGLMLKIIEVRSMGVDPEPFICLLRETLLRFDDRLEVEQFIPGVPAAPMLPPGMPPGQPSPPMIPQPQPQ